MTLNKSSGSCWTVIAKKDWGRVKGHGPVCKLRAYEAEWIHFTASAKVESRETAQSKAAGHSRPKSASKKQTDRFAKFRISLNILRDFNLFVMVIQNPTSRLCACDTAGAALHTIEIHNFRVEILSGETGEYPL